MTSNQTQQGGVFMTSGTLTVTDCTAVTTYLYTEADLAARVEAERAQAAHICRLKYLKTAKAAVNECFNEIRALGPTSAYDAAIKAAREEGMETLQRLVDTAELLIAEVADPGTEALAAIYCAKAAIRALAQEAPSDER